MIHKLWVGSCFFRSLLRDCELHVPCFLVCSVLLFPLHSIGSVLFSAYLIFLCFSQSVSFFTFWDFGFVYLRQFCSGFDQETRKKDQKLKMENKKEMGSSSSFTADLSGFKESTPPSSSTGVFASIFPPPSRVMGRNSSCSELLESIQKQSSTNRVWSTEQGTAESVAEQPGEGQEESVKSEVESNVIAKKKSNSIFQERVEPCPLSSSLCYGGLEDMYVLSSSTQGSGSYPIFKNDTTEDDLQIASRGNWWQGSLYY